MKIFLFNRESRAACKDFKISRIVQLFVFNHIFSSFYAFSYLADYTFLLGNVLIFRIVSERFSWTISLV